MKLCKMAFIEWLAGEPSRRIFLGNDSCACPIACFLQECIGYPYAGVTKAAWRKNRTRLLGIPRKLPEWALVFVQRWDERYKTYGTTEHALRIAQTIAS